MTDPPLTLFPSHQILNDNAWHWAFGTGWYNAKNLTTDSRNGAVISNALIPKNWFFDDCDQSKAERLLGDKRTGTFLIRRHNPDKEASKTARCSANEVVDEETSKSLPVNPRKPSIDDLIEEGRKPSRSFSFRKRIQKRRGSGGSTSTITEKPSLVPVVDKRRELQVA